MQVACLPLSARPMFGAVELEQALANLLDGVRVNLRTAEELSLYLRDVVIGAAEVQYAV